VTASAVPSNRKPLLSVPWSISTDFVDCKEAGKIRNERCVKCREGGMWDKATRMRYSLSLNPSVTPSRHQLWNSNVRLSRFQMLNYPISWIADTASYICLRGWIWKYLITIEILPDPSKPLNIPPAPTSCTMAGTNPISALLVVLITILGTNLYLLSTCYPNPKRWSPPPSPPRRRLPHRWLRRRPHHQHLPHSPWVGFPRLPSLTNPDPLLTCTELFSGSYPRFLPRICLLWSSERDDGRRAGTCAGGL